MGTRTEIRSAGVAALATAVLLAASQTLYQGGPPSTNPWGLVHWFAANAGAVRAAAILWLLAMLGLGVFAIAFREAMWATVLDRAWVTMLFTQGAVVFAVIAVVATAATWTVTIQAASSTADVHHAVMLADMGDTLLLFATWGLAPPLVVISPALWRHSGLARAAAVTGLVMAAAVLLPFDRTAILFAFSGWLGLAGATLLVPAQSRALRFIPSTPSGIR